MSIKTIAILMPGDMGHGCAIAFRENGFRTVTNLSERSERTKALSAKAGIEDLEVAETMFVPPESDDINKIAEAFGKQVLQQSIKTDCAVFTQFVGSPRSGVEGISTIVVDKTGKVLLAEMAEKPSMRTPMVMAP